MPSGSGPSSKSVLRAREPSGAGPAAEVFVASRSWVFFALTLSFTWILQLPALLAKLGVLSGPAERFLLPAALGGFGPLVAAVMAAKLERGGTGLRSVFGTLGTWRVGFRWYLVALGGFAALYVAGLAGYRLAGGSVSLRWFYPPENAQQVAALFVVPLTEEPGWRGFALPRLQRRYGRLRASLVLGALWAIWHSMMFVLQGVTPASFCLGMLVVVAGSVLFSWIYNHTQGSLLLALVAHAGVHLSNPFRAQQATALAVYAVALLGAALAVVCLDREAWAPQRTST